MLCQPPDLGEFSKGAPPPGTVGGDTLAEPSMPPDSVGLVVVPDDSDGEAMSPEGESISSGNHIRGGELAIRSVGAVGEVG